MQAAAAPQCPPWPQSLAGFCEPGHQHGLCFPMLTAHSYLAGQVGVLCIQNFTVEGRIRMAIRTKGRWFLYPPNTALNSTPEFQQDAPIEGREQRQRAVCTSGLSSDTVRGCRELPGTVCSLP